MQSCCNRCTLHLCSCICSEHRAVIASQLSITRTAEHAQQKLCCAEGGSGRCARAAAPARSARRGWRPDRDRQPAGPASRGSSPGQDACGSQGPALPACGHRSRGHAQRGVDLRWQHVRLTLAQSISLQTLRQHARGSQGPALPACGNSSRGDAQRGINLRRQYVRLILPQSIRLHAEAPLPWQDTGSSQKLAPACLQPLLCWPMLLAQRVSQPCMQRL